MYGHPTEEKLPVFKNHMIYSRNHTNAQGVMAHLHWHGVYEVLYIKRGFGEQRINTETYHIRPGDIVILKSGDLHATKALSLDGCDIDYVQFSEEFLIDKTSFDSELQSGVIHSPKNNFKSIFEALDQFEKEDKSESHIIMTGLLHILTGFLLRECHKVKASAPSSQISALLEYMEQTNSLKLETVAAHIGYSPEHLSRKFKKETGISYRNYADRIRMRRAIIMLEDEKNSIAHIAEELCYSDESSFIRAFRRMYGITPSLCRNSFKL